MSRLSLVAEFDDLVRSDAVLSAGIDSEFCEFVVNQELCRKHWLESERQYEELTVHLEEVERDNDALKTKLKHARSQIEREMKKRQLVEQERDTLEHQISVVRELLNDKNLDDRDRERLAFLSADFPPSPYEASVRRNLTTIDESGSILSPSDISFDKTEEDLDDDVHVPRSTAKRRPSAPPETDDDDDDDLEPSGKRSRRVTAKKRHRRSNSADVAVISLADGESRSQHHSIPDTSALPRAESAGNINDAGVNGGPHRGVWSSKRTGSNKSVSSELMPMKRFGSGNSLTRLHVFVLKNIYKHEPCSACGKKPRFGSKVLKCKECRITAHVECRDLSPLPCIPTPVTPTKNPSAPGVIADYVSSYDPPMIPALVIRCVEEVNARGWKEEGIYRVPGSDKDVKELKDRFLRGKLLPNLALVHDIHVVCGCLKDFLRGLKEPLVTFRLWSSFAGAVERTDDELLTSSDLYQAISELPQPNRDTLAYIILHLQRVSENAECKMSVDNLSTVFGPTVVGYSTAEPTINDMMVQTKLQQLVMRRLMNIPSEFWWRFVNIDAELDGDDELARQSQAGIADVRYLPKYDQSSAKCDGPVLTSGKANAGQSSLGSTAPSSSTGFGKKSTKRNYFDSPQLK